ncbi:MAG: hypothetical protein L0H31_12180 [Nocardioidaceae bacterium]|nr:hypothetical protein [Nocardioidaceae bacterium]
MKNFRAAAVALPCSLVLVVTLAGCGGGKDAGAHKKAGQSNSETAAPKSSAATAVPNLREFSAFENAGTFDGSVIGARGDTVVTLGDGSTGLGQDLTGLVAYSPSGVKRADFTPAVTPCGYEVAGTTDARVVTNELEQLPAQGTVNAGWKNTIRIYDESLKELKAIELPEVRGDARELWLNEPTKSSCELQVSADGRWVVAYDAKGWLLVDTDDLTATPILDH